MSGIALLVPNEEMYRAAHDVLQEMKLRLEIIREIETDRAVSEARQAIRQGAEIIIARGLQATMIKQYTDIPVVEITLTPQDVTAMLEKARRILHSPGETGDGGEQVPPQVAIVMFRNMACDMSGLGERCGVTLREYYVQNPELLREAAQQAVEDRADLIIGGETVLSVADEAGVPSVYLVNSEASLKNAILEAQRLQEMLEGGSLQAKSGSAASHSGQGAPAPAAFVNFPFESEAMGRAVRLAARLAPSGAPKLLIEPSGTLYHAFASAIHNHSPHSGEKLLVYDCVEGESAYETLFGKYGMVTQAAKGSLQINFIEHLDRRSQQRLLEILRFRNVILLSRTEKLREHLVPELYARLSAFAIRIPPLSETPEDIRLLTEIYLRSHCERCGHFHVLTEAARETIEALPWPGSRIQLDSFLERLVLTAEKRSITDRMVAVLYEELYGRDPFDANAGSRPAEGTSGRSRTGDRAPEYPGKGLAENNSNREAATAASLERDLLLRTLAEHFGNREKTAASLGISKTTLWRKLRKYGIL